MAPISERIKELAARAEDLEKNINELAHELEMVVFPTHFLEEVPGYLRIAQGQVHNAYMALDTAEAKAAGGA